VCGERLIGDGATDAGQVRPFRLGVGRQHPTASLRVERPALDQFARESSGGGVEALQPPAGARLPHERGAHPVLGQPRPRQLAGTAGEFLTSQRVHHGPRRQHVLLDGAGSVHRAVRMDQLGQANQQIACQPWVR